MAEEEEMDLGEKKGEERGLGVEERSLDRVAKDAVEVAAIGDCSE